VRADPHTDDTARFAVLHDAADALVDELAAEPALTLDYLALADPELRPAPVAGPARLLVAARAGSTRLIDNVPVRLGTDVGVLR